VVEEAGEVLPAGPPPPPPHPPCNGPHGKLCSTDRERDRHNQGFSWASRRINHDGPTHDEGRTWIMTLFGRSAFVRPANVCLRSAWLLCDWAFVGFRLPDWCWRNKKS
jgi:hypothetical protein